MRRYTTDETTSSSPSSSTQSRHFACADAVAREQNELLRRDLRLVAAFEATGRDALSAASLAPYARTAPSRLPYAFRAIRLTSADTLYDLGSGDGSVVVEAARRYGCRCVGLEHDAELIAASRALAAKHHVAHLCDFVECDLTKLSVEALDAGIGAARSSPTVAFAWLTGGGLRRFSSKLKHLWSTAAVPFRIVTCVDALDTCCDYMRDGVFAEPCAETTWDVHRGRFAEFGVFATPPRGTSLETWARDEDTTDGDDVSL